MEGGGEKAFSNLRKMTLRNKILRILAKVSGKNYVEDFIRVYRTTSLSTRKGITSLILRSITEIFESFQFYEFASQYLEKDESVVLDAGCGSGYGAKILKDAEHERLRLRYFFCH